MGTNRFNPWFDMPHLGFFEVPDVFTDALLFLPSSPFSRMMQETENPV